MVDLKDIQKNLFSESSNKLTALQGTHNKIGSRDDFIKNFLGERVEFDGKILAIEELHGSVAGIKMRVSSESNYSFTFFGFFSLTARDQLLKIDEGAYIRCTGKINKIDRNTNEIELIGLSIQNSSGVISGIEDKSDHYRRKLSYYKNKAIFVLSLIISVVVCSYIFFHWILFIIVLVLIGFIMFIAETGISGITKTNKILNCKCGYKTDIYLQESTESTSQSTTMERNETFYDDTGNISGYSEIEVPSYHNSKQSWYIAKCRECKKYLDFNTPSSLDGDFMYINLCVRK